MIQLEKQIVRYIVDRYNQNLDARMGNQSRIGRWETAQLAQLPLLSERELDICLMRQERRRVYRSGYVQFANLSYQGDHLAGYAGEEVVLRYNPRDITTILVYQQQGNQDVFLARAHAIGLEAESLSLAEAQAISRRVRAAGKLVTNQSVLTEVQDRDRRLNQIHKQKQQKQKQTAPEPQLDEVQSEPCQNLPPCESAMADPGLDATERLEPEEIKVPEVRVWDYEELKRNYGKWW